ncbi:hypothetical protein WJX73_001328 [Symbiochloris irregularis]|uniref:BTB domain-containing protein n=1 Tax=Symbiochloris irregularis TaxID=706552 RepID=A0AAW1PC56_9CHLO
METACSDLTAGYQDFQARLQNVVQATQTAQQELKQERAKLAEEREAFAEERSRVQQVISDADEQITLNVGGSLYVTSTTTLKNSPLPSLFTAMFSGRHELKRDQKGHYFFDRDPRHFHDILNYLRDGSLNYPISDCTDFRSLLELRAEAEFFGLVPLVAKIDSYPYDVTIVHRAVSIAHEEAWCYEDGADEVIFTVDRPVQLLGVGLCSTEGSFTADVEILEVAPDDYDRPGHRLDQVSSTFVKTDSEVVRLMLRPPIHLHAEKHYKISAHIKGSDTLCCEECLERVVAGGVTLQFKAWESPNGTNEERGQFPELYIRTSP